MAKLTHSESGVGTSFHNNTVTCTIQDLIGILGQPQYAGNTGEDKVNFEWICETDDGDVFTIYDWKEYKPLRRSEKIEWHIGAKNGMIAAEACLEIKDMLKGL